MRLRPEVRLLREVELLPCWRPGLIFMQPVSGCLVDSVHSMAVLTAPGTWLDRLSYSRRDDELTTNAQVPGTLRTPFHNRNLIYCQPIQLMHQRIQLLFQCCEVPVFSTRLKQVINQTFYGSALCAICFRDRQR